MENIQIHYLAENQKQFPAIWSEGLKQLMALHGYTWKVGDIVELYDLDGSRVYFVGMGELKDLDGNKLRKITSLAIKKINKKKPITISFEVTKTLWPYLQSIGEGYQLANFDVAKYKTGEKAQENSSQLIKKVHLTGELAKDSQIIFEQGVKIAQAVNLVRDLVNGPSNIVDAEKIASLAKEKAKKAKYQIKVLGKKELSKLGLNALLGVNQGSKNEAKLVLMEYLPLGKKSAPVALVGKGVTFDTGGVNLKPSDSLKWMKMDMAGSAVVLAVFQLLAELKLPINVVGLLPLTDNAIDANAQYPQDIITSYSGKTIEIDNTDAEGRLILADAITYAIKHYQPQEIIDLATLTGAVIVALGDSIAGLFSNNEQLATNLIQASKQTDEAIWRMPITEEHRKDMKGKFSDLINAGSRVGGACTAAAFLEEFVEKTPWAHLDIAGVAKPDRQWDTEHYGATGFGVRLILQYLINQAQNNKPSSKRLNV